MTATFHNLQYNLSTTERPTRSRDHDSFSLRTLKRKLNGFYRLLRRKTLIVCLQCAKMQRLILSLIHI